MPDPDRVPIVDRPTVLTVAGLDPSGGAGLLQDVWVLRTLGLHVVSVMTGVAVQNSTRFLESHLLNQGLIRDQLQTLSTEFLLGAVKTGMLGGPGAVEYLGSWLEDRPQLPLVLDPVLMTSTGGELHPSGYTAALKTVLIPRATVLTPNLSEAEILTGFDVSNREQVPVAARGLRDLGATWVLIKGGHLPGRDAGGDFLLGPNTELWLESEFNGPVEFRGTGCAFASALAGGLALGETVVEASRQAKRFVEKAMAGGYGAGAGTFLGTPEGFRGGDGQERNPDP